LLHQIANTCHVDSPVCLIIWVYMVSAFFKVKTIISKILHSAAIFKNNKGSAHVHNVGLKVIVPHTLK
jgi:hypothetical protein